MSGALPPETIPENSECIEVRVTELRQLFNAIDPSPFRERDLDPNAEEFIVDWARDLPRDASLALRVHLDREAGQSDEEVVLREAVHEAFTRRAASTRRTLRELIRRGRTSLVIGLLFLTASLVAGDMLVTYFDESHWTEIFRESLLIGGWVAMWRPLEIFLYDWWPIRADARFYDRLSKMPVTIAYRGGLGTRG